MAINTNNRKTKTKHTNFFKKKVLHPPQPEEHPVKKKGIKEFFSPDFGIFCILGDKLSIQLYCV